MHFTTWFAPLPLKNRVEQMTELKQLFEGVFISEDGKIYVKSGLKGFRIHGEKLFEKNGLEYREWNAWRSKLAAAFAKGLKTMPLKKCSSVLYLGAAQGVTASFISDIVGEKGVVYCVEFSPRAMQDLLKACGKKENMLPLLADARNPGEYAADVGKVDVIFEDVADTQQTEIMRRNAELMLEKDGYAMIAIKARCVSSVVEPKKVFAQAKKELEQDFEVIEEISLEPFEADHEFFVLKKR